MVTVLPVFSWSMSHKGSCTGFYAMAEVCAALVLVLFMNEGQVHEWATQLWILWDWTASFYALTSSFNLPKEFCLVLDVSWLCRIIENARTLLFLFQRAKLVLTLKQPSANCPHEPPPPLPINLCGGAYLGDRNGREDMRQLCNACLREPFHYHCSRLMDTGIWKGHFWECWTLGCCRSMLTCDAGPVKGCWVQNTAERRHSHATLNSFVRPQSSFLLLLPVRIQLGITKFDG